MKNEAIHNKDYSVVKTLRAGQLLTRSSFLRYLDWYVSF